MSERARGSSQTVSLFPFLAVLVCAMGALILLLLVTTRRVRQVAVLRAQAAQIEAVERQQAAVSEPPAPPAPPEPTDAEQKVAARRAEQADEARRRIDRLMGDRDRKQSLLDQMPTRFKESRERLVGASSQFASLNKQLQQADQDRRQTVQAALSMGNARGALLAQIAAVEDDIGRTQRQKAQARSRFAIVPYDGTSGTTRRPILIECRDDSLRFVPENVVLTPHDLDGFTMGYNPLLAGARALVDYWSRRDSNPSATEPEPYVLLIVRPDGSVPFYVARRLLGDLRQPYGYELLEQDCELDLPKVDPGAQKACIDAVRQTLAERQKLYQAINAGRVRSGEQMHFRAGASGFAEANLDESDNPRDRGGPSGRPGSDLGATRAEAAEGSRPGIPRPTSAGPDDPRSSQFPREASLGASEDVGLLSGSPARGSNGFNLPGFGKSRTENASTGSAANPELATLGPTGEGLAANGPGSLDKGDNGRRGGDQPPEMKLPQRETSLQRDAIEPSLKPKIYTFNKSTAAGADGPDSQGDFPTWAGSLGDAQTAATSPTPTGAGDGSFSSPSAIEPPLSSLGTRSKSSESSPDIDTLLARNRWGLSGRNATIGYERPVEIRVLSDRVIVADDLVITVGRGESREQLLSAVALAIDRHVRSWGPPPDNFYWVPALQFVVSPGGNQHYERLHDPFRKAGLFSTAKFTLEADNPPEFPHAPQRVQ